MAIHLSRLITLNKFAHSWYTRQISLTSYLSKRNLQEFPKLKLNNVLPQDHVLILPEQLNESAASNELMRIPKVGDPEVNYSKLDVETVFKGFSQVVCDFENFLTDINNNNDARGKSIRDLFKEIEQHLYQVDSAYNILIVLMSVDSTRYNYPEIYKLFNRYYTAREKRFDGIIKDCVQKHIYQDYNNSSPIEKRMLNIYYKANPSQRDIRNLDEVTLTQYREHINRDMTQFKRNLEEANQLFSHTIDEPDILAAVSSEFDDCIDLHHKERTPLKITSTTYHKFMKVCPDRIVRQLLWQTRNKRCSPKAIPKYNNINLVSDIRVLRRKVADLLGYRTHVEYKLVRSMAKSRPQILDNLKMLGEENSTVLTERLQELNDYAADNGFDDPNQLGIQEYDVDFWTHKYKHDILIGKSEADLKTHFPLPDVLTGLQNYFKNYYGIELQTKSHQDKQLWDKDVKLIEVIRKNQPLGTIIFDPYQRPTKRLQEPSYGRLRIRNQELGCLPSRLASTSFKIDPVSKQALLSFSDILGLFNCFGTVIQRLMYCYDYYELNICGGLDYDSNDLLPNLCTAHILTDHRILQSCSNRGGSKTIDSELSSRILKAHTYFNSFKTSRDLFIAHLDIEAHTSLIDIKTLVQETHQIYSPFSRNPNDFDYCAMDNIFVGPNDGTYYAGLWSKQLANFCLAHTLSESGNNELASTDINKIRDLNVRLLDILFDPEKLDTNEKLNLFVGRFFEPSKASLGVL